MGVQLQTFCTEQKQPTLLFSNGNMGGGGYFESKGKEKKPRVRKIKESNQTSTYSRAHYPYSTFTILANYKTINPLPLKIATAISLVHPFFTSILVIGCIIFC